MPARKKLKPIPSLKSEAMAPEYQLDYSKSKPNRFARQASRDVAVVVLDEDVARVYRHGTQVNDLLRAVIKAVRAPRTRRAH